MSNIFYQETNSVGNYNYNNHIYNKLQYGHHFHKNFELIYVIKGTASVQVDEKTKIINEGEFVFIFPNQIHSISAPDTSRVWIAVFSRDYISEFASKTSGKVSADLTFTCSEDETEYLLKTLMTKTQKTDIYSLKSCLYMVCSRFLKECTLVDKPNIKDDLAHTIIKYLEENFKNDITLMDISKEFGYEYHYLSRCFKNIFHIPFKSFLNLYRFDYAMYLLLKTDKNMTEIAIESGFGSLRNFNRIYKKFSDKTPMEVRKQKN